MKEIKLTCPFTGVDFKALECADGSLIVKNPISGETLKVNYNYSIKRLNVSKSWFKHVEMVTIAEASEILEVSRQRITAIAKNDTIKSYEIAGRTMFCKSDVLEYKETRKTGRPSKDR